MKLVPEEQPAVALLRERRLTYPEIAKAIQVDVGHLSRVMRGTSRPHDAIRERLPEYLGVPLEKLFTERLLALPFLAFGPVRSGGPIDLLENSEISA